MALFWRYGNLITALEGAFFNGAKTVLFVVAVDSTLARSYFQC